MRIVKGDSCTRSSEALKERSSAPSEPDPRRDNIGHVAGHGSLRASCGPKSRVRRLWRRLRLTERARNAAQDRELRLEKRVHRKTPTCTACRYPSSAILITR